MVGSRWRRLSVLVGVAMALVGGALPVQAEQAAGGDLSVAAVSTPADKVTGGDVLAEITVPDGAGGVSVSLEGADVTSVFSPAGPGRLLGLVEGLGAGLSTLEVRAGGQVARLRLTNHAITGPVFSGPHQSPFICQTQGFGLGPALDTDCSAPSRVDYLYRPTGSTEFLPLDPTGPLPDDVAQTTTSQGATVNYIVRRERGTINRAVYEIAFLHEPGTALPDPWTTTNGWNDRLVYTFGGGCNAAYRQGASTGGVLNHLFLSQGYGVASSSFNVFGNNCNDVTSAETVMMVKEHFVESFGDPAHTIGWGGSGGSMQQHLIGQNYPGVLDGILPSSSFSDVFTLIAPVSDCSLLDRAMAEGTQSWTVQQRSAVTGYADNGTIETCTLWGNSSSRISLTPSECPAVIPVELTYDPVTNPGGARCTPHDNTVNVFGRDPATGFARRPLDNVGVQYGLKAFNDGIIDFTRFIELNQLAGGWDVDGNLIPERSEADRDAVRIAYATGRVQSGAGGLADIPIIDFRGYVETNPNIHDRFRSFSTRERLIATNGHADNHAIWIRAANGAGAGRAAAVNAEVLRVMDEWLTAIGADTGGGPASAKVVRNKPADAVDTCWTAAGDKIVEPATYDGPGQCNQLYPSHADPRIVAGAPLANDVLKCALKKVDPDDYTETLTKPQIDQIRRTFPDGVCDFTRPGIGQRPLKGTWLTY